MAPSRLWNWLKALFRRPRSDSARSVSEKPLYEAIATPVEEVHQVWDYLRVLENTQAFHIVSVLGFEEWVDLKEIMRRVQGLFGVTYQNERSLYPYLKTLGDAGLLEYSDVGGKRRWRKKELWIALKRKKRAMEEETEPAPLLVSKRGE